jgi:hypothetical protein
LFLASEDTEGTRETDVQLLLGGRQSEDRSGGGQLHLLRKHSTRLQGQCIERGGGASYIGQSNIQKAMRDVVFINSYIFLSFVFSVGLLFQYSGLLVYKARESGTLRHFLGHQEWRSKIVNVFNRLISVIIIKILGVGS